MTPESDGSKAAIGLLTLFGVPIFGALGLESGPHVSGVLLGRIVQITYGKARLESLPQVARPEALECFMSCTVLTSLPCPGKQHL